MPTTWKMLVMAVVLAMAGPMAAAETAGALACRQQTAAQSQYVVCAINPALAKPRLFWKGSRGQPYRSFEAVAAVVADTGASLAFAMNAGMYTDDFTPLGLHVEEGRELRAANTIDLKLPPGLTPNFYKKPNGVLFVDATGIGIMPTSRFLKRGKPVISATQSGPMLVIDGTINPIFIPGSTDRTRRSGVGICEGGIVHFAISEGRVNFHDFAQLFRDELKCRDALFLDGGRGAGIFVPALDRADWSGHGGYGPIIGLVE